MSRLLAIIAVWLLLAGHAYGADVFVSTTGNDTTGIGTISSPFRTIQKGIDGLKIQGPGNTLFLRGGIYTTIPLIAGWQGEECRGILFKYLNDATSWENPYTIRSYPGEWAVIDADGYTDARVFVLAGSYNNGEIGYIEISHLEIKNAHGTSGVAGIVTRGGPYKFRYLSIHDNLCDISDNNPGGLSLHNGTGRSTIEYCYFRENGTFQYVEGGNENSANLDMFSDYKFDDETDTWGAQVLESAAGYTTARYGNIVRYNYFDGGSGAFDARTGVGIKQKAPQFLVSETVGTAIPVDVNGWYDKGDELHHNIIINHNYSGIFDKGDFGQNHNNIIDSADLTFGLQVGTYGRGYRGPWQSVSYNNTLQNSKGAGINYNHSPTGECLPSGCAPPEIGYTPSYMLGVSDYFAEYYTYNNLITGEVTYDAMTPITYSRVYSSILPGGIVPEWDIDSLTHTYNNYMYDCVTSNTKVLQTDYSLSSINALTNSADNKSAPFEAGGIYVDDYKLNPSYSDYATVSTGGKSGVHPYLEGVTIPAYIGAVNPDDDAWVDGVQTLSDTSVLRDGVGDPDWIEGAEQVPTVSITQPSQTVPNTTTTFIVSGTTTNAATVTCDPVTTNTGTVEAFIFEGIPLAVGPNVITVTASDGETYPADSVTITREAAPTTDGFSIKGATIIGTNP